MISYFKKQLSPARLMYYAWWVFWILAQAYVLHMSGVSWSTALADAGVTMEVLALAGLVISNTYKFYTPSPRNITVLAGYTLLLAAISTYLITYILSFLGFAGETSLIVTQGERMLFALLMIALLVVYHWLRNTAKTQEELKKNQQEAERLLREAELARLRQQLQPHFLFNSLNSISALAGSNPEGARNMVQQLSDFLRGTLKKDEQQLVSLDEELKHINLYLSIEKVRFGHRLSSLVECEPDALSGKLPALLLQPIVENAVKFGVYDTVDDIVIRITARVEKSHLVVQVENPYDPSTARPKNGTGFGLSSVKRRLYLLYARHDLLETQESDHTFITTLRIPQSHV